MTRKCPRALAAPLSPAAQCALDAVITTAQVALLLGLFWLVWFVCAVVLA